jgi:hypothetical protein
MGREKRGKRKEKRGKYKPEARVLDLPFVLRLLAHKTAPGGLFALSPFAMPLKVHP